MRAVDNSRTPSVSEVEILETVVGKVPDNIYLLQSQLKDSNWMIATDVVTPCDLISMRVMNPTSQAKMLYKGTKVASLWGVDRMIFC